MIRRVVGYVFEVFTLNPVITMEASQYIPEKRLLPNVEM